MKKINPIVVAVLLASCGYEPNPDAPFVIRARDPAAGDGFGRALALSPDGERLAVAASAGGGRVHVYQRGSGSSWTHIQEIAGGEDDGLGADLKLSSDGTVLAVTKAQHLSLGILDGVGLAQARWTWLEPDSDSTALGPIGLAGDGNTLVAGDPQSEVVHAFTRASVADSMWASTLVMPERAVAQFGATVALSGGGDVLAVGSAVDHSVHMFESEGGVFTFVAELALESDASGLGWPLALSGNGDLLLVGAPGEVNEAGGFYLFNRAEGGWSLMAHAVLVPEQAGTRLGASVGVSHLGDVLALGGPYHPDSAGVQTLIQNGPNWELAHWIMPPSVPAIGPSGFGGSLAISSSGTVIAIGAAAANDDEGLAYVYEI